MSDRLSDEELDRAEKMIGVLANYLWTKQTRPGDHIWSIPADETRDFDCLFSRALAELRERRAADQWQPIETAPKDGTRVLVARYMPPYGWILGHANWRVVREVSGWVSHGLGAFGELGLADPTHWRPLPAPPTQEPSR